MTTKDKELLLNDLSARLQYGVKMNHIVNGEHQPETLIGIAGNMLTLHSSAGYSTDDVDNYKPYLLPTDSITIEQEEEVKDYLNSLEAKILGLPGKCLYLIDWYNKNHIDYRGLIDKELAIDATGLNIY